MQYVDALNEARDEIVAAIEGAADILKDIDPEAAQEAGGDVAFMVAALPHLDVIKRLEFAAVISVDHNDLPHLKAWGGVAETKQRIERFKRPLSQDPLAILVVKSKLLTGFDAKVEQAMYLDRAISGAELLQAIARTNRTAGEAKRFGIVVDYYGVGKNLADALALYDDEDKEDLTGGIGKPEELLPELRQARDAVVKHFADAGIIRGAALQPYVDDCVAKLKDQKLRAQFLILVKKLVGLFDTLMPRPEARPFSSDVKLYAFIAKAATNLYRDKSSTFAASLTRFRRCWTPTSRRMASIPRSRRSKFSTPTLPPRSRGKRAIAPKRPTWRTRSAITSRFPSRRIRPSTSRSASAWRAYWRAIMKIGRRSRSSFRSL